MKVLFGKVVRPNVGRRRFKDNDKAEREVEGKKREEGRKKREEERSG